MKTGVLLLKPDIFEDEKNLELFNNLLKFVGLTIQETYDIPEFGMFLEKYRKYDISHYNMNEEQKQKEFNNTMYATYTYDKYFHGIKGQALLFEAEDAEELYGKLSYVKKSYRKYVKESRPYSYLLTLGDKWEIKREHPYIVKKLVDTNRGKYEEAYINGVHLEDKELYDKNVCLTFLKNYGIVKDKKVDNCCSKSGEMKR